MVTSGIRRQGPFDQPMVTPSRLSVSVLLVRLPRLLLAAYLCVRA